MGINEKPYAYRAGEKTLNEFLLKRGLLGKVEINSLGMYGVRLDLPLENPSVTIIIPTRNQLYYLNNCISSILKLTTYSNYEILIVDNNTHDANTLDYLEKISSENKNISVLKDDRPFNFSMLVNKAVTHANGSIVVLLNNDTKVITPQWLTEMVCLASLEAIGAVGARLFYKNDTLQHGGVFLGVGKDGVAGHMHRHLKSTCPGYFGRAVLLQEVSAVTAACMVVKKEVFLEVGGFDEINLPIAFNDVDFCLKLKKAGYRNLWTPKAKLYHYESISRGSDLSGKNHKRFLKEVEFMHKKWGKLLQNDPAYNPNLTLEREDFSLAWPPRKHDS